VGDLERETGTLLLRVSLSVPGKEVKEYISFNSQTSI
jgi:hypothetical protein